MADDILAARVRELFHYDPETGAFIRKVRVAQRVQVGDRADLIVYPKGSGPRRRVAFDSMKFLAHRVAWLYVHGRWPDDEIDHINGDATDNRLANLRDVRRSVNMQNLKRAKSHNKSGFLGVYRIKTGAWVAQIRLGSFDTPEEASAAYIEAKRKLHEGCTL